MKPEFATDVPSRTATTRVFTPSVFQLVFSAAIPPVFCIRPGDTVRTTTLDNRGYDGQGVLRSRSGNPLTGPFYVEEARPGDTLAIRLDSIRPNRNWARSGARFVRKTVTSSFHRSARYDSRLTAEWYLDLQNGLATLATPSETLSGFAVPLRPFLGCVGVAPVSNEAFGPTWLGQWGGNLDYNHLAEGTTLYLPVFQTGALLSFGDGHAVQGDGEIAGDAIETSMDVEFTVDVVPHTVWPGADTPRATNAGELMAFGIAKSIEESLQKATTSLAEWLRHDYALTDTDTALVLGTSVRYDVAEIVNPHINVVARIRRAALAPIRHMSTLR